MEKYPDYYYDIAARTGFDLIYRNRFQDFSLEVIIQTGIEKFRRLRVKNCGCHDAKGNPLNGESRTCVDRWCRRREFSIDCEDDCAESITCCNRPGTDPLRQVRNPLCDVREVEGKGNCLFTLEPIREHEFVMEYVGDVLPYSVVAKRENDEYSVRIKYTSLVIDPLKRGNLSRFASHSHDPNMEMITHRSKGRLQNFLVALKNIHAGDELTFQYNKYIGNCKCEPCLKQLLDATNAEQGENNDCHQPSPLTSSSSKGSKTSKKIPDVNKPEEGGSASRKRAAPTQSAKISAIKLPRIAVKSITPPQQVKKQQHYPQRHQINVNVEAESDPAASKKVSIPMPPLQNMRRLPKLIRFYQPNPNAEGVKPKIKVEPRSSDRPTPKMPVLIKVSELTSNDETTRNQRMDIRAKAVTKARSTSRRQIAGPVLPPSSASRVGPSDEETGLMQMRQNDKEASLSIRAMVPAQLLNRFVTRTSDSHQLVPLSASQVVSKGLKKFDCDQCEKNFVTKRKLYEHRRSHRPKKYKCTKCPKAFTGRNILTRHLKTHLDYSKRLYACENCPQKFTRNEHLLRHLPTCKKPKEESEAA